VQQGDGRVAVDGEIHSNEFLGERQGRRNDAANQPSSVLRMCMREQGRISCRVQAIGNSGGIVGRLRGASQ
jgi:hypothetical protein